MFKKKEKSLRKLREIEKRKLHHVLGTLYPCTPEYQKVLDQLKEFSEIEQIEGSLLEKILPTALGITANLVGIIIVMHWEDIGNLFSAKALNVAYKIKS